MSKAEPDPENDGNARYSSTVCSGGIMTDSTEPAVAASLSSAVSDLIGRIYDCAIDPDQWETTLPEIAQRFDCERAILSLNDLRRDRALINRSAGWEPRWLNERQKHLPEIHGVLTRWLADRSMEDGPFVASRELSPADLESSAYVRDCLAPLDIVDVAHFFLLRSEEHFSELVLFRQSRTGIVTAREIELGQLLLPHLRRALTISRLLDIKTVARATLEHALDALTTAIVLVGDGLRIVHANRAGRELLAAGDGIFDQTGRLAVRGAGADAALAAAVVQAAADECALGQKGLGIPARTRTGTPLLLNVLPLRHGAARSGLMPSVVAAIFIAPAQFPPPAATAALKALFDITPAEGAVLDHLVSGRSTVETASLLGVGLATVKTHLQHIFDKTGVRRQSELVKLVASFALPLKR